MNQTTIFHAIKDPVHGTMQFTHLENNWIKPFIDSPVFQRLRHIKQLGLGDYIFPGAVHTRFNHCLGCCYVASQIAHKIGLSDEARQLVMIACLLHDIGHGPFSHTFEDIFHDKLIRHEAWTPFFLADFSTEDFFHHYNLRNPQFPLNKEKFALIEAMIMHRSQEKDVLADIVSSQLDADRLDYLLRDSHFCGVTYGEFDFSWMLNSMTIVSSFNRERLGLTHKGIGVVEQYLMARRLMTRNIYHHQKKLALEFFLVKLLSALAGALESEEYFQPIKVTRLGQFLMAVHQFNQQASLTSEPAALKQTFLVSHYANYKELCDYDIFAAIKLLASMPDRHPVIQLARRLAERRIPKIIRLERMNMAVIESLIADFKSQQTLIEDWQFALVKTPHQAYSIENDPILVLDAQHQTAVPLNEISLMIHAISDKYEQTAFLCVDREIFTHPAVIRFIDGLTKVPVAQMDSAAPS